MADKNVFKSGDRVEVLDYTDGHYDRGEIFFAAKDGNLILVEMEDFDAIWTVDPKCIKIVSADR